MPYTIYRLEQTESRAKSEWGLFSGTVREGKVKGKGR